jgi:hypothetical protein
MPTHAPDGQLTAGFVSSTSTAVDAGRSHFLDWAEPDVICSSVLTLEEELTLELDKHLAELKLSQRNVTRGKAP